MKGLSRLKLAAAASSNDTLPTINKNTFGNQSTNKKMHSSVGTFQHEYANPS